MGKVIKIEFDGILVKLDKNGKLYKLNRSQFDFEPIEGDTVSISKRDDIIYVTNANLSDSSFKNSNEQYVEKPNKVLYIVLLLTAGGLGAHRFYAKKSDAKFYLIPSALSLVTGIVLILFNTILDSISLQVYVIVMFLFIGIVSISFIVLSIKLLIDLIKSVGITTDINGNFDI